AEGEPVRAAPPEPPLRRRPHPRLRPPHAKATTRAPPAFVAIAALKATEAVPLDRGGQLARAEEARGIRARAGGALERGRRLHDGVTRRAAHGSSVRPARRARTSSEVNEAT